MELPFTLPIGVRSYELDPQGHVNGAVYVQYADHALWECFRAAGLDPNRLLQTGVGPVNLETNIRFLRELRGGDEVIVSCIFEWGEGKTFRIVREFANHAGEPVATVTTVTGLLDLKQRKLVANPAERCQALAERPTLLGLEPSPAQRVAR
jgi:acyl-CoA thioester hydrolase